MCKNEFSRRAVVGGILAGSMGFAPRRLFAQASQALPITIANASGAVTLTMHELLKQKRFLEEFGLQPEVLNLADGSKIAGGIISGNIDVTTMSGIGQIFAAMERGGKLKILAGAALLPTLGVFTSKPDIRSLKDLEGRTVGVGAVGALLHQLMLVLLQKHDVDAAEVKFVNIGSSVDVFRAAVVGTVDAGPGELAVMDQPDRFDVTLVENGNIALELPEFTYQGGYTSDRAIEDKRDTIVRTMAAYAKLYRFVQSPEAQEDFLRAHRTLYPNATDAESLAQWNVIQTYKPFAIDLELSQERLDYLQNLNIQVGTQSRVLLFDQVADMSLARDALALLG